VQRAGLRDHRPRLLRAEHLGGHAEPERERQQIAHGDWTLGRFGVVERAVHPAQHPRIGQFRQQHVHRLVQGQRAFPDQGQGRRAGHRLGGGRNAEQRIAPHRGAADGQRPQRLDVHLISPGDQRHEAGHRLVRHVRGRGCAEAAETLRGQQVRHGHQLPRWLVHRLWCAAPLMRCFW
jgi:hypothetical protein